MCYMHFFLRPEMHVIFYLKQSSPHSKVLNQEPLRPDEWSRSNRLFIMYFFIVFLRIELKLNSIELKLKNWNCIEKKIYIIKQKERDWIELWCYWFACISVVFWVKTNIYRSSNFPKHDVFPESSWGEMYLQKICKRSAGVTFRWNQITLCRWRKALH